jgi:hypothetical protein
MVGNAGLISSEKEPKDYLSKARRELGLADHMTYVTMPLITDRNLFMSVVGHLYNSVLNTIFAFLEHEKDYKRLVALPPSERDRVDLFLSRYTHNLEIESKTVDMIRKIVNLGLASKGSYTQFKRSDKFVILSPKYNVLTIDKDTVKKYLSLQKLFINKISERLKKT